MGSTTGRELKLAYASDWHLGFLGSNDALPEFDRSAHALLLSGDTFDGPKTHQIDRFLEHTAPTPVFLILGNHDCYKSRRDKVLRILSNAFEGTHARLLDNEAAQFNGVTILGTDLWTDFELLGAGDVKEQGIRRAREAMNDYRQITFKTDQKRFRKLHPIDTLTWHVRALDFIGSGLSNAGESPVILMTHHAPFPESIPHTRKHDPLSPAYASDITDTLDNSGRWPDIMIHGHIHLAQQYQKGNTKILTNPHGYPKQVGTGFDAGAIIRI